MFPPGAFCPLLRLSDPQRPRLRQRAITVPAAPVVRRMRVAGSGVAAGPGSGAGAGPGSSTGAGPGSGAGGAGGSLTGAGPGSGAGGLLAGGAGGSLAGGAGGSLAGGAGGSGATGGSGMIGASGASSSPPPPPPWPGFLAQVVPVAATIPATAIAADARRTQRANSLMNAVSSFLFSPPPGTESNRRASPEKS